MRATVTGGDRRLLHQVRRDVGAARGELPGTDGPTLPVTRSILSGEWVLAEIQNAYALRPFRCRLIQASANDVYVLDAPGVRFFARLYRVGRRSMPDICWELELLCHLAARGVSVSRPVPCRDGSLMRPVRAPEGTRYLAVFTNVEGVPLPRDEKHSLLAGHLAASIHTASDNFSSPYSRTPLDLVYLIDRPLAALRPFLAQRPEDWRFLEGFAGCLRKRAATVTAGIDWGPCHGDFNSKNIHVTADGTLAAFDFDMCGPCWRVRDLMSYYGDNALWDSFLAGYTRVRRLTGSDLAAMPLLAVARSLWALGNAAANGGWWGFEEVEQRIEKKLRAFRRWEAEHLG